MNFVKSGNFIIADKTETETTVFDSNLAQIITGIISEVNEDKGFIKVYEGKTDEFSNIVLDIYKLCNNVDWIGLGHDKTIDAIYTQLTKLAEISESLYKLLTPMKMAIEEYSEGVSEVDNKFKELRELIEIEKAKRNGGVQ